VAIARSTKDRWRTVVLLLAAACCAPMVGAQELADDDAPAVMRDVLTAPERSQLEKLLSRKIEDLDEICRLSDDQNRGLPHSIDRPLDESPG
jgi:hypothetical protein